MAEADPPPLVAGPAARWQFRLWHLFVLTAVVAVAAGLARALGPGVLPLVLGIAVAGLNAAGGFSPLQRGWVQTVLLLAAWALFLTSLALPAVAIFQSPARGGTLAWFMLIGVMPGAAGQLQFLALTYAAAVNGANLLAAALPVWAWRLSRGRGERLAWLACVVIPSTWVYMERGGDLYVGYYVWAFSFVAVVAVVPLAQGQVALALALAAYFNFVQSWS